jgi:Na+/H+ antiporter NhaD/arsenite permease-like protein
VIRRVGVFLQEQILVVSLGVIAACFALTGRVSIAHAPEVVDFELLMVLFALLVSVELLRESGLFERVVAGTLRRFTHSRPFVGAMVGLAGVIAMLLTNDVALFIVIPFTVLAGRLSRFDVRNAVILEIVAANLLGCLTPLGNPQNLFLYHAAGWSAGRFVATMLPFCAWSALGLAIAVRLLERKVHIGKRPEATGPLHPGRATAGAACFLLVALEIFRLLPAWPAAALAALCLVSLLRHRLGEVDLSIVPLFFFAFIIVEGLRSFSVYRAILDLPFGDSGARLYGAAILLSQAISNVPAAILLEPLAQERWALLLYGVNAGGCGTIIASLANLLGWRIFGRESGDGAPGFVARQTLVSFAFLAWIAPGAWVIARMTG